MQSVSVPVPVPRDFSLKTTALSHGWHECAPMFWCEAAGCLQLIERENQHVFRVSVRQESNHRPRISRRRVTHHGTPLRVTIEGPNGIGRPAWPPTVERMLTRLRITLALDHDLHEFYQICLKRDPLRIVPRIGAGRLIRSASMTENILKMLCSTNVNWTQAVKMINRLAQLGPHLPHFRNLTAWPTPAEILRAGEPYLSDICRLGYRTGSVIKFCHDVEEGRFDPEALDAMAADPGIGSDEIARTLRTIRGIGPTSANALLGFLGRHDRLAIDSATIASVKSRHPQKRTPTVKQIERMYAPLGKWKNLVCWLENWLTWDTAKSLVAEAKAGE